MEAGTLENRVTWGGLAEIEGARKGKWLESLIVSRAHLSREEIYFEGVLVTEQESDHSAVCLGKTNLKAKLSPVLDDDQLKSQDWTESGWRSWDQEPEQKMS